MVNTEGPLCSNCAVGFARAGTNRFAKCNSCGENWTSATYYFLLAIAVVVLVLLERKLFGTFESRVEEIETDKAPVGVALVIGNSKYENWPINRPAKQDAISVEAELKKLGYITFLVNDATKSEMEAAIKRFRSTLEQVSNPERYAHLKDKKTGNYTASPWPSLHAPGLQEGEIAGLVFFAGHATQFPAEEGADGIPAEGMENFLVPVDCDLNAESPSCVPVADLMNRKIHQVTKIHQLTAAARQKVDQFDTGPSIVMIDAGHAIASGPTAEGSQRDIFQCPISHRLIFDPVKLVQDGDEGWSYDRVALEQVLSRDSCTSPMTGQPITDPTIIADDKLKDDIREFQKRSTLCKVLPPDDNSMIIFACEPEKFSVSSQNAEKGGIFSQQFVKIASLRVNIIEQMQKLQPLIIEASDGKQAPWFSANLRKDTQKFSLSGKFAIEGGEKNDNPNFRADLGGPQTVDSMLAVLEAKEKVAICQGGELTPLQKLQLDKLQAQAKAARVGPLSPFRAFYKKHKATFFTWVALGQVLNGVGFAFNIQYPPRFVALIVQFKVICIDVFGQITFRCIFDVSVFTTCLL